MSARAIQDGDSYRLTGRKLDHQRGRSRVVPGLRQRRSRRRVSRHHGLSRRPRDPLAVGKKEDKLGIRASSTCEVVLDDCRVSKDNVLGEVGKGYKVAIETLNEGRIGIAAQMTGLRRALDHALAYSNQRNSSASALPSFRACSSIWPRWRWTGSLAPDDV